MHIWGYATGCPACSNLKALFDLLKVPYVFYPITPDSHARNELRKAGFDTVPQVFTQSGDHLGDFSTFKMGAVSAIQALSSPFGGT
jgi:glutaredoxin